MKSFRIHYNILFDKLLSKMKEIESCKYIRRLETKKISLRFLIIDVNRQMKLIISLFVILFYM